MRYRHGEKLKSNGAPLGGMLREGWGPDELRPPHDFKPGAQTVRRGLTFDPLSLPKGSACFVCY